MVLLAANATALPSFKSCVDSYPQAEHTVPLYMTTYPFIGNFEANITVGSQNVTAVLDTGSSNTWFMSESVECVNTKTLEPISNDLCGFEGSKLKPSPSFQGINAHYNLSYGSGGFLIATACVDNVSFAGFDLLEQNLGLSTTASVFYPGKASGLVGLAYPSLSAIFPGEDPSTDRICSVAVGANNTGCNSKPITPLQDTIFATGQADSVFSFALGRGIPNAGIMAIGGLPNLRDPQVNVTEDSIQVTVPMEKLYNSSNYTAYVMSIDAVHYPGAPEGAGEGQYVVDTGTVTITVGEESAKILAASFDPPAWINETLGDYVVQCNATAPDFAMEIAGQLFNVTGKDLILELPPEHPFCYMGVQAGLAKPGFPPILGSVFLRNVLAVFDVGRTQMTFASRMNYEYED